MVMTSILILAGLGLAVAVVLGIASKVFYVEEDPKVEAVLEALPGANCGGCGYAGCEGYAIAVVNIPTIAANLCVAGGKDVAAAVGQLTGKAVTESDPLISFRRCDKISGKVQKRYSYQGMPSCAAAATLAQGSDVCAFSCLGFGDCVVTCPFDALYIQDNIVRVRENLCTGCGKCTQACPRNILELIPRRARVAIRCSTQDKLRAVMDVCEAGCIQCSKCIKTCPANAISFVNNRITIDQKMCLAYGPDCDMACVSACPRKILRNLREKDCLLNKMSELKDAKPETKEEVKTENKATENNTEVKTEKPAEKVEKKEEVTA